MPWGQSDSLLGGGIKRGSESVTEFSDEDAANNPLFNVGRFLSRPFYTVTNLLKGDVAAAAKQLPQMVLDFPTGGFLNRDWSLGHVAEEILEHTVGRKDTDTADFTTREERPEVTDLLRHHGLADVKGLPGVALDIVGGVALDPLTYMSGAGGIAKSALTGAPRVAGALRMAGLFDKTVLGRSAMKHAAWKVADDLGTDVAGWTAKRVLENPNTRALAAEKVFGKYTASGADFRFGGARTAAGRQAGVEMAPELEHGILALERAQMIPEKGAVMWRGPLAILAGKPAKRIGNMRSVTSKSVPGYAMKVMRTRAEEIPDSVAAHALSWVENSKAMLVNKFWDKRRGGLIPAGAEAAAIRIGLKSASEDVAIKQRVQNLYKALPPTALEEVGEGLDGISQRLWNDRAGPPPGASLGPTPPTPPSGGSAGSFPTNQAGMGRAGTGPGVGDAQFFPAGSFPTKQGGYAEAAAEQVYKAGPLETELRQGMVDAFGKAGRYGENAALDDEMVEAAMVLVRARADRLGMDVEKYVDETFLGVTGGLDDFMGRVASGQARRKAWEGRARGNVQFERGMQRGQMPGKALIRGFGANSPFTLYHELGHVFLREEVGRGGGRALEKLIGESVGVPIVNGAWKTVHDEAFARGFERYLASGEAPAPGLKEVFEKFKQWVMGVWERWYEGRLPVSEEAKAEISKLFGKDPAGAFKARGGSRPGRPGAKLVEPDYGAHKGGLADAGRVPNREAYENRAAGDTAFHSTGPYDRTVEDLYLGVLAESDGTSRWVAGLEESLLKLRKAAATGEGVDELARRLARGGVVRGADREAARELLRRKYVATKAAQLEAAARYSEALYPQHRGRAAAAEQDRREVNRLLRGDFRREFERLTNAREGLASAQWQMLLGGQVERRMELLAEAEEDFAAVGGWSPAQQKPFVQEAEGKLKEARVNYAARARALHAAENGPDAHAAYGARVTLTRAADRVSDATSALEREKRLLDGVGTGPGVGAGDTAFDSTDPDLAREALINRVASDHGLDVQVVRQAVDGYQADMAKIGEDLVRMGVVPSKADLREFYVPHQASELLNELIVEAKGREDIRPGLRDVFTRARTLSTTGFENALKEFAGKVGVDVGSELAAPQWNIATLHMKRALAHNRSVYAESMAKLLDKTYGKGQWTKNAQVYLDAQTQILPERALTKWLGGGWKPVKIDPGVSMEAIAKLAGQKGYRYRKGKLERFEPGVNAIYKPLLTSAPTNVAFHVRNHFASTLQHLLDPEVGPGVAFKAFLNTFRDAGVLQRLGKWEPSEAGKFLRAIQGDEAALAALGTGKIGDTPVSEAVMWTRGLLGRRQVRSDLMQEFSTELGKRDTSGRMSRAWGAFMEVGEAASEHVENTHRAHAFLELLAKKVAPEEAAERVDKMFVRYAVNSEMERTLRDVFMFARFTIGSSAWAAEYARRPGATGMTAMNRLMGSQGAQEELPAQVQGTLGIPMGVNGDGYGQYLTSAGLPHEAAFTGLDAIMPGPGMVRSGLSAANPLVRGPFEQAFGQSFRFGTETGSYRRAPQIARLADAMGVDGLVTRTVGVGGVERAEVEGWVNELLQVSPVARQNSIVNTLLDERKGVAEKFAQAALGIRSIRVDQLSAKISILNKFLKEHPGDPRVPKAKRVLSRLRGQRKRAKKEKGT